MNMKRNWTLMLGFLLMMLVAACKDDPDPQVIPPLVIPDASTTSQAELPESTAAFTPAPTSTVAVALPTDEVSTIQIIDEPADEPALCSTPENWTPYNVVFGDTLAEIARRTDSTVAELSAANCLDNPNRIRVGLKLLVPRIPDPVPTAPPVTPVPDDVTTVYDVSVCFTEPFMGDMGVALGERWRLDYGYGSASTFANPSDLVGNGEILASEPFTVVAGPHCFHNGSYSANYIRRWYIESEVSNRRGWVDEYQTFLTWQPAPELINFTLSTERIAEGETITISWEVRGANEVSLWQYHNLSFYGMDMVAGPLPPAGSLTVTPPKGVSQIEYSLNDFYDDSINQVLYIDCEFTPFGLTTAQGCPTSDQVTSEAAYQSFEHGYMIWKPGVIWVFFDTGYGQALYDGFSGSEIQISEEPPDGLFKPERGFGKVWAENQWIRDELGWATALEEGYTMDLQVVPLTAWDNQFIVTLPSGVLLVG